MSRQYRPVETLRGGDVSPQHGVLLNGPVPMLSLDSTMGLRRGRAQESAPPSDSARPVFVNERGGSSGRETHPGSLVSPSESSRGHLRRTIGCPAMLMVRVRLFVSWLLAPRSL